MDDAACGSSRRRRARRAFRRSPRRRQRLRERLGRRSGRSRSGRPASGSSVRHRLGPTAATRVAAGLGAVLGSKRLKAIAARGVAAKAPLADPARVLAAREGPAPRSLGPGDGQVPRARTVANVLIFNRLAALPDAQLHARAGSTGARRLRRDLPRRAASCATAAPPARSAASTSLARRRREPRGSSTRALRARTALRDRPTATRCSRPRALRRPRHRRDLRRRHDRLRDGVRRARPDRRAVARASATARRCCARSTRSAARARRSATLLAEGSRRAAARLGAARATSRRTSRGWSCPATSRAR